MSLPISFREQVQGDREQYEEWMRIAREEDIVFDLVPERYLTEELICEGLKYGGNSLQPIRNEFRTENMCLAAVEGSFSELEFVPKKLRTDKIALAARKSFEKERKEAASEWRGPTDFTQWMINLR